MARKPRKPKLKYLPYDFLKLEMEANGETAEYIAKPDSVTLQEASRSPQLLVSNLEERAFVRRFMAMTPEEQQNEVDACAYGDKLLAEACKDLGIEEPQVNSAPLVAQLG